ncbi:hypothetical protein HDK64DRAFT_330603, partial [Phyllosticta capitalensis]
CRRHWSLSWPARPIPHHGLSSPSSQSGHWWRPPKITANAQHLSHQATSIPVRDDHTRTHEPPQANCASSTTLLHPTCRPSPLARRKPWINLRHLRTGCLLLFPTPSRIHHHRPSSPRTAGPVITLHQAMQSCAIAWHGMAWHGIAFPTGDSRSRSGTADDSKQSEAKQQPPALARQLVAQLARASPTRRMAVRPAAAAAPRINRPRLSQAPSTLLFALPFPSPKISRVRDGDGVVCAVSFFSFSSLFSVSLYWFLFFDLRFLHTHGARMVFHERTTDG